MGKGKDKSVQRTVRTSPRQGCVRVEQVGRARRGVVGLLAGVAQTVQRTILDRMWTARGRAQGGDNEDQHRSQSTNPPFCS